jgi:hypothetical protein
VHQRLDANLVELVEDLLQALGVATATDAVVQCLERDAGLLQLPFGVLVAVETDSRGVREVRGERDERDLNLIPPSTTQAKANR